MNRLTQHFAEVDLALGELTTDYVLMDRPEQERSPEPNIIPFPAWLLWFVVGLVVGAVGRGYIGGMSR